MGIYLFCLRIFFSPYLPSSNWGMTVGDLLSILFLSVWKCGIFLWKYWSKHFLWRRIIRIVPILCPRLSIAGIFFQWWEVMKWPYSYMKNILDITRFSLKSFSIEFTKILYTEWFNKNYPPYWNIQVLFKIK